MKKIYVVALACCVLATGGGAVPGAAAAKLPKCQGKVATIVGTKADETIGGTRRADVIVARGGADLVRGRGGNDTICAGSGNDTVDGNRGGDVIAGGGGINVLVGGSGNDTLGGGSLDDSLYPGAGDDEIAGGTGRDNLYYTESATPVTVDLAAGTATGEGNDTIARFGTDPNSPILSDIERVFGSAFADSISGDAGSNSINGGGGNDTLDGRDGEDFVRYELATGGVRVDLVAGTATGADGDDILTNFEFIIGSNFDDTLTGDQEGNSILGLEGNDDLEGGGGPDTVRYDAAFTPGDTNTEGVTVDLSAGTASGAYGNDTLSGFLAVRASNGPDTIIGRDEVDEVVALAGNDTIQTRGEADYIEPGPGNDTVDAGGDPLTPDDLSTVGDTVVYVDAAASIAVDLGPGTVTGGSGSDTLSDVEFVVGTNHDDTFKGSDAPNEGFSGEGGDDLIDGGGGALDTVDYSFSPTSISADLSTGRAVGDYDGTDTLIGIEWLIGTELNDVLVGDGDDEIFEGRAGNDEIRAGAGTDRIDGGDGTDTCRDGETVTSCEG